MMFNSPKSNGESRNDIRPFRPVDDYHVAQELARAIANATGTGPKSKGITGSVEKNVEYALRYVTGESSYTRAKELLASPWRAEFLKLVNTYYNGM